MPPVLMLPTIEYFLQVNGMPVHKSVPDGTPDLIVKDGTTTYLCWAYGRSKYGKLYKICRISKSNYIAPDLTEHAITKFEYPYGCTGYNFILSWQVEYDFYYFLKNYTFAQRTS